MVRFLLLTGAVLLAGIQSFGVVIRHDRTDADALRLGEPFTAVGKVLPDGCCTLIATNWAVTAAHVASSLHHGSIVEFGGKQYHVKRIILHPQGVAPKGQPPEVDLALIELEEPVLSIKPVGLYRENKEQGSTIFIVGYGDYGNPQTGLHHTDGRRRAVTNVIDDAGPRRIFAKFDSPPKGSEYEGVGGPGDSGGPALVQRGNKFLLVGISSASMDGKPGQYGVTDVYTRVSSYCGWIDKMMQTK